MTKRLLDLILEDKQRFVASFDYVLTDCDGNFWMALLQFWGTLSLISTTGVVWNFYGPIEGVGRAIGVLKDAGKKVVYVSNNSVRTLENYKEQVHKLGHGLAEEDLIHPAISVVRYLKSINFQGLIYAICAEPFLKLLKEAGFEVITGAIGAIKAAGKRVVYVSNNSVRPLENYQEQIRKLGHEVTEEDLVHPAVSIVRYLKSIDFNGLIYAIGSNAFLKTLRDAGYDVLNGPDDPQPESLQVVIPVIHDKKPVKAVIVDYDFNCSHIKLLRAEMYLKSDQECLFVGGSTDYRVMFTPTYTSIGTGYYTEILERSVGRKAVTLGKPGTHLVQQLKDYYGIEQA
ncbi:4-nitrophenylphosphatase [Culex quinquefasciatus]|uniref:4-nitrophenylphosphatase n=1 Tax=Culex quinquefasciatus TaxID=7176 RepID=B0WUE4_CULQU|nr:4-nitrophenylphosphatase [Culex quinquefasciatus]|eukprot:XP_001858512.1 4-nitrophenylphosphatase [Culex quinquefasciatus]